MINRNSLVQFPHARIGTSAAKPFGRGCLMDIATYLLCMQTRADASIL